jgi:hypothetical protein
MKRRLTRKEAAPPNPAARALSLGQFRPKVAENPKAYTRKQKHKKGSLSEAQLPLSLPLGRLEDAARPDGEPAAD